MKCLSHSQAAAILLALALFTSDSANAQLITSDPSLPPQGVYITPDQVHASYSIPGLNVTLNQPRHSDFTSITRTTVGADEMESFSSVLAGTADVDVGGTMVPGVAFSASGPVQTIVFGKAGHVTGTFQTEMLSMAVSGITPLAPFTIRESPTLASRGTTTIEDIGGGMYRISSFFDVFTELTVDGGQTWIPDSSGPTRVVLVPEPKSIGLISVGVCAILIWMRRKRA